MTETTAAPKKPRKLQGARAHVITVAGKEWLLTLEGVRVATADDLNRALDGGLPRASVMANQSGHGGT